MLDLRHAYALPAHPDTVELRAFTHGLMPRTVPAMMQHFVRDWQARGVDAWNEVPNHWRPGRLAASGDRVGWWTLPEYLGDEFVAPLLQAPPGTCIMQPNVHWSLQGLLSAPETWRSGRTVVTTEAEFPSVLHSLQRWQDLLGLTLHVVPPGEDGFVDRGAVLDAVDGDTALVALSHVGFTTGETLPDAFLRNVAERAHEHGGLLLVDGYHAVCSQPVDVQALAADIYVGGLLKEGSGSSGSSFVYLRPGLDLSPRTTGWFGDADPFGFGPSPALHPDVRRRFLGGTTSVASLYHAVEGVRVLLEAGLEAVREHSLALTNHALRRAEDLGLRIVSPHEPARRSAMVVLEVEAADRLCTYLKQRHVYTDSRRARYLRMAPFVWNTRADVDRAFDVIGEALLAGAYLTVEADETGPVT